MLNPVGMDKLSNNSSIPKQKDDKVLKNNTPQELVKESLYQESNHSLTVISAENVTKNQKEDIFWGHFDLNMSKSIENNDFAMSSSMSMSIDIFGYNKNGISEENKENLADIFGGKDFEELQDSFFSLNGSDSSIEDFSNEIDDLFEKISETLDMDEDLFEGSKKLLKFTAVMFSNSLDFKEDDAVVEVDEAKNNLMIDTLAITAKLYAMVGNIQNMNKKVDDAMLLEPNNTIKEFLSGITDKYSLNNKNNNDNNNNDNDDLFQTLNRLSKLSQKFDKFI